MFRPTFGEQIAWAESNAIVFANSVIGARTARYGDFIDLAAAMTGRVPYAGLHVDENRRGEVLFVLPERCRGALERGCARRRASAPSSASAPAPRCRSSPGCRRRSEDDLKALGATAASTGLDRAVPCRRRHPRGAGPCVAPSAAMAARRRHPPSRRRYRRRAYPSHHCRRTARRSAPSLSARRISRSPSSRG